MKRKLTLIVIVLAFAMLACTIGGGGTTQPPEVTQPPSTDGGGVTTTGELTIVNHYDYISDDGGRFSVSGDIQNNTNAVASSIMLALEVKDASGNSLLTDENGNITDNVTFYTLLSTLAPDEATPFTYDLYLNQGQVPDSYVISIDAYDEGQADRAQLEIQNAQLVGDEYGYLYLTGELVNLESQWVYVNGLSGAAMDADDNVVSADSSYDYATYLAPAGDANGFDRTPFVVDMYNPVGVDVTQWLARWDADLSDQPDLYDIDLTVDNNYFDDTGWFHLVGTMTNNSSENLNVALIGGLYAADDTVLDAEYDYPPMTLQPDEILPFDLVISTVVAYVPSEAERADHYTVQVDPYGTYPSSWAFVRLETTNDDVNQDGDTVTFTGNIVNTSKMDLSGAWVVVAVMDAQDNLIAANSTYVFPTNEKIVQGETTTFEVNVYLAPGTDTTGFTFSTFVQGDE